MPRNGVVDDTFYEKRRQAPRYGSHCDADHYPQHLPAALSDECCSQQLGVGLVIHLAVGRLIVVVFGGQLPQAGGVGRQPHRRPDRLQLGDERWERPDCEWGGVALDAERGRRCSVNDTRRGPGANPGATQCTAALPGSSSNNGAGGGAGGSFSGPGNNGGNGPNGVGAVATAASLGTGLHGGCPGSLGGASGTENGPAGFGGGAIYLVAGTSITITKAIRASGGGGLGGTGDSAGGGGGGSGGMIVIESPLSTLSGSAELAANGGGGGEGSLEQDNNNGGNGGQSTAYNAVGAGGSGLDSDAGNGGVGAIRTAGPGLGLNGGTGGSNIDGGGGGGGGGLGLIWYKNMPLMGDLSRVSPTAVQGS